MLIMKEFAPPPLIDENDQIDNDHKTDCGGNTDIQAIKFQQFHTSSFWVVKNLQGGTCMRIATSHYILTLEIASRFPARQSRHQPMIL